MATDFPAWVVNDEDQELYGQGAGLGAPLPVLSSKRSLRSFITAKLAPQSGNDALISFFLPLPPLYTTKLFILNYLFSMNISVDMSRPPSSDVLS